ncbi:hypothetical protein [Caulobacter sp.]|uniref:hypothetical protein n=1 Tax=Caulobacter sp. TaxID=78 RepID=UPI002B49D934|nr:hypothetical protein [Caulobacter sp.]HJV42386.1 hypothetical protein [Caulobacter sp.]
MLLKHTSTMDLGVVRDGRKAVSDLKVRIRYNTLTQADFDRLVARIQAAFDELDELVDESPDPSRALLYLIAGGARG